VPPKADTPGAGVPNAEGFPNAVTAPVWTDGVVPNADTGWPKALTAGLAEDGCPNADTPGVVPCELKAPNPPVEGPPKADPAWPNAVGGLGEPNALTPNEVTPGVGLRKVEFGWFRGI